MLGQPHSPPCSLIGWKHLWDRVGSDCSSSLSVHLSAPGPMVKPSRSGFTCRALVRGEWEQARASLMALRLQPVRQVV